MRLTRQPHQDLIHDFFVDHDRAAAFAGIGLGKTAATLDAFRTNLADGCTKAMLVIAPMRVANLTWPNEIAKWEDFRGLKVERLRDVNDRPSGKASIYLTNYERLNRLSNLSFCDTVIFDELTRAKSHQSERINSIRPLLTTHRRWGLTGTPRPNSLLELFAQIRLLDDGKRLSPSFVHFQKTYFEPEDWNEYRWLPKAESERKIYEKIHDLVITLKSSDYLDVPDTVVEDIEVPLSKDAHGIYRELERELLAAVGGPDGDLIVAQNAAVLVNKLLQVCSGAVYVTRDPEDAAGQIMGRPAQQRTVSTIHPGKINALKRLLVDTAEPALIACNFIHERDRICEAIPGAVDAHKFKGDIEDAWNSGSIKYLVADPRGLGHGLNLQQGGRDVVWFSPCHSRELYDQMNGRVARKGQEKIPRVFRITCPGTIDDVVIESLRERGDAQTNMMNVLTNFRLQGLTFP